MFRKMKRKKKQLSTEETIELLKKGEEGVLATTGSDGYPYAVPLNYAYHNDSIYFHCAQSGHKIDNIHYNSKVSFCVIQDAEIIPEAFNTTFKSAIIFGTATEAFDGEKERALRALVHKFSSNHLEAGDKYIQNALDKTRVFKIDIEHISGKSTK